MHGKIEIKNWEWHTKNNVRWDINQGGQSTKVDIKDIDLKKICDKASVTLYQCCVTGKHIKNGKIICRKNDGDSEGRISDRHADGHHDHEGGLDGGRSIALAR